MVTSVPPYEISILLKIIFFISLKTTKITSKILISEVCDLVGYFGHVTYSFINMLFISTGIFYDKLRPLILSVDTIANSPLKVLVGMLQFSNHSCQNGIHNIVSFISH
jgi:hypothetical protein